VICSLDFFEHKMPGYLPASTYPFACNITNFATQICLVVFSKKLPFTCTIVTCFLGQAVVLALMPFVVNIGGAVAYWTCFSLVLVFGIFSGTGGVTLYRMVAAFPPRYIASLMLGIGVAGVSANVMRAVTLWSFPADERPDNEYRGTLAMFSIAIFIMLLCVFC